MEGQCHLALKSHRDATRGLLGQFFPRAQYRTAQLKVSPRSLDIENSSHSLVGRSEQLLGLLRVRIVQLQAKGILKLFPALRFLSSSDQS
jgi:hypothetical protein